MTLIIAGRLPQRSPSHVYCTCSVIVQCDTDNSSESTTEMVHVYMGCHATNISIMSLTYGVVYNRACDGGHTIVHYHLAAFLYIQVQKNTPLLTHVHIQTHMYIYTVYNTHIILNLSKKTKGVLYKEKQGGYNVF